MNNKGKTLGKRRDYTHEDFLKIQEENKRKLDEIYARENWMEWLGKKYYGENYLKTFPDNHPAKQDYRKAVVSGQIKAINTSDETDKIYYKTPIIQINEEKKIEWNSIMEYCETYNKSKTSAYNIRKFLDGKWERDVLYESKWEWKN